MFGNIHRVGTQGLLRPYLKTFVFPSLENEEFFNPARDVDARFILASMMLMPQMLEMVTTQN